MRGNEIVLSAQPQGKFEEGFINNAVAPGICMEIVPGVGMVGGRARWRPTTRAAGASGAIVVLREDRLQGFTQTSVYAIGTVCFLYWPIAGEELNMQVEVPGTGTGTITSIGQRFSVAGDGSGALTLAAGTWAPFSCKEAAIDLAAPGAELVWVQFLGAAA